MDIEMLNVLKGVNVNLSRIAQGLERLAPPDSKKNRRRPRQLRKALRDPDVRQLIFDSRRQGLGYREIEELLKQKYPDDSEMHLSRNSIFIFITNAASGHLSEFGIYF